MMTKQELFTDPQFLSLTEQQQNFIRALIESGNDHVEAARVAYRCKNLETAKAIARRARNHTVIRRLIDKFYEINAADRLPSHEEFAARMWERAEGVNDPAAAFKYYQLYSDVQGFKKQPNPAPVTTPSASPVDDTLMAEIQSRLDDGNSATERADIRQ